MIKAAQIRAARALLGVNQIRLSEWAGISVGTVKRVEAASEIRGAAETLWKIQVALENAGVVFIPDDDLEGPGVRLKESTRSKVRRKRKSSG
jgi:transcriptional regulator with XRE-family HTH domain